MEDWYQDEWDEGTLPKDMAVKECDKGEALGRKGGRELDSR